jgi:dTDP-4-amino-4,6-dideoxygalactose transaminase
MRRQLPVYSPVAWGAIAAGASAAVRGRARAELREQLLDFLRRVYGARDALLTDSGTSALRLALAGTVRLDPRPVALPGYGCYDLASAAQGAGARVALYDVEPTSLGPDRESLAALHSTGLAAVVVAHFFGHLVDVRACGEAVGDALIIEDAAQGSGGRLHGRPLGSFGSLAVLSFGRGKGVTGGAGGALLAHDERGSAIVEWARSLSVPERGTRGAAPLAALVAQKLLGRPEMYALPSALPFLHLGETVYHPPRAPRGMPESSVAALGRVLPDVVEEVTRRARNARRLEISLAASPRLRSMKRVAGGEPGYLRLPALVRQGGRDALLTRRVERLGVASGYPTTLAALPSLIPRLTVAEPRLPGSSLLAGTLMTLPTHSLLTERDVRAIEDWLAER